MCLLYYVVNLTMNWIEHDDPSIYSFERWNLQYTTSTSFFLTALIYEHVLHIFKSLERNQNLNSNLSIQKETKKSYNVCNKLSLLIFTYNCRLDCETGYDMISSEQWRGKQGGPLDDGCTIVHVYKHLFDWCASDAQFFVNYFICPIVFILFDWYFPLLLGVDQGHE